MGKIAEKDEELDLMLAKARQISPEKTAQVIEEYDIPLKTETREAAELGDRD